MPKSRKKNLVIVESPAKARTLAGFLGSGYDVRASIGHVRDLPKHSLGVDIEGGFVPNYVIPREKQEVVRKLNEAAQGAEVVYLATDPDREGEAISWHLASALGDSDRLYRRVVFHEVTPEAVRQAFLHPRDIDTRLVEAQQARRLVDRLVGYKISPILWKKVRRGLSAGRVQSVALRMVVEREREVQNFVPKEFWTIDATLSPEAEPATSDDDQGTSSGFVARLVGLAHSRKKLEIGGSEEADRLVRLLRDAVYRVAEVREKEQRRRPPPPFTTSTLQQEASRRLGFSARRTMAVAQQLYEGISINGGQVGLITYMRTDSTRVSEGAKAEARAYVRDRFGQGYLPPAPRVYRTRARGAQEAHEAIRPTSIRREPDSLRRALSPDQYRLYTLVWQRMLASQMADALYDNVAVDVLASPSSLLPRRAGRATSEERRATGDFLLRAASSRLRFPGYRILYQEWADDGEDEERALPPLSAGEALRLMALTPEQHFTEPPPRYTEATLVRALEENGIGRPSTYAPILSTIQDRGYVEREGRQLRPTELGFVVSDLLVERFPDIVDVNFTAAMEEDLDEIARGEKAWQPVVQEMYQPLEAALAEAARAPRVEEPTDETCQLCGRPMVVRWGRSGRFLTCSGFPECKGARPLPSDLTDERCGQCDAPMVVRRGRYGPFLACSRYPECRGTRRIQVRVGVACPNCGADIVERRTRKGRTFYGCSGYPRCRFTAWSRPLPRPCPQCGGLVVAGRGNSARCTNCAWKGPAPRPDPEPVGVD